MKLTHKCLLSIFAIVGFLIVTVIPARASFPGRNGRIAFVNGPDVYTMNPDGSNVRQLTNLGPDRGAFFESWSPDGRQIAFTIFSPNAPGQLWIMNADGGNQHILLAESDFDEERPSFTPDGSSVLFTRCRLDIEACALYRIGVAGGSLTSITDFDLGISDYSPKHSPVGQSLAFIGGGRRGIICAIYLASPNESTLRQITPAPLSARQPDWSPDGRKLAFSTHCGNPQNEEIWVVDRDGDGLRQLTNNGTDYLTDSHDFNPSWSPQGDAIVFERDAPDFSSSSIFIMNHDGTGCRKLFTLRSSPPANLLQQREARRPRGAHRGRHTVEIEQGGALPQWGVATN
jgi:Tol biopolymer transport system component